MSSAPHTPPSSPAPDPQRSAAPDADAPLDPVLAWLRLFAVLTAALAVAQAVLGFTMLGGGYGVLSLHHISGYLTFVVSVIAAIMAALWSRRSGNVGLMAHAITVAVLALAQVGLGEMGLRWVHTILGTLFLVAAVALATLSLRRGGASRAQRRAAA